MKSKPKPKTSKSVSDISEPIVQEVGEENYPQVEDRPSNSSQTDSDSMREDVPPVNAKALSEIPTQIVAGIAAQLNSPVADPAARVLQAYDLLDAAESARNGLLTSGSYIRGVHEFKWARVRFKASKAMEREIVTAPAFFWGEKGETRLQFDPVLNFLFGGAARKIKESERQLRIDRLVTFLQETSKTLGIAVNFFGSNRETESIKWMKNGADRARARKLVDQWIKDGVPGRSYPTLKHHFPQWWENQVAKQNSKNRKGKKRVPLKRTDGRKGARTSTFFDALKKTT